MDYAKLTPKPHHQGKARLVFFLLISIVIVSFVFAIFVNILLASSKKSTSSMQTVVMKNPPQGGPKPKINTKRPNQGLKRWRKVTVESGDSLSGIFQKLKLSKKTLNEILDDAKHAPYLKSIKSGQTISFLINDKHELEALLLPIDAKTSLEYWRHNGSYSARLKRKHLQKHAHYVTLQISNSLFQSGRAHGVPFKLLRQLSQIFAWEVDFSRDLRSGDRLTLIYDKYYDKDKEVGIGSIIAAELNVHNRTYKAIRYKTKDGKAEYYTPEGKSLRKAFIRFPVKYSHISSPFSNKRVHPVLDKVVRAHRGVDLAAPMGTPIKAASDGKVVFIGRNGGYGNAIKIQHNKKYLTLYAHMRRFRKGLHKGMRVKKGDIIGYVGQTGLADGPHLHYEFHIYGKAVNPVSVTLPRAPSISAKDIAQFKYQAHSLIGQLELYQAAKTQTA